MEVGTFNNPHEKVLEEALEAANKVLESSGLTVSELTVKLPDGGDLGAFLKLCYYPPGNSGKICIEK